MNKFKRFLAAALALVLLFTACPQTAFAAGEQTQTALNTGNVTVEGTNAFGRMLSNDIMATQTETESEYEAGYVVTNLEIEGKRATIEYSSLEDAIVVVALYSEDGMQLLASGDALVRADEEVAYVTLEGEMPEYFLASAYLMDTYDLSPLCAAYDTPMYTREMQELLA